jgi:predicted NUDIX family NTP pyrophosphohydrolase
MAEKNSAGLMMFRRAEKGIEIFLVHPGGHVWTQYGKKMNLIWNC